MTLDELYDEFEARLYGYALGLARDRDRADDLVQETFTRALVDAALLEILNPFQCKSWLYRTLKNAFLDEQRSRKRQAELWDALGREIDLFGTEAALDEIGLLDGVPENDREVLEMRYVFGMNSTEIGQEIGLPPATVRSRIHAAIRRLRRDYET